MVYMYIQEVTTYEGTYCTYTVPVGRWADCKSALESGDKSIAVHRNHFTFYKYTKRIVY